MDLKAETAAYQAEVERIRAVVDTFAVAYADAMAGIALITDSTTAAQRMFEVQAQRLNAEAAERGLPVAVSVPDLAAEVDLALVLRGVQLPPESSFSAQARRAGDAHG